MRFIKDKDIYKIARITGTQDNILGVSFTENETNIQVVEWNIKEGSVRKASSEEVLAQVVDGLRAINEELGSNYKLSKIYYLPTDSAANSVYKFLIAEIVKRVNSKGEFVTI
jgi:RNA polymerase-interacting CarD/CdnL/TRCF family regulator